MKIVIGRPDADIYVLVGNGGRELRILSVAAERYDHSRVVGTPRLPSSLQRMGTVGLDGVIRGLDYLLQKLLSQHT